MSQNELPTPDAIMEMARVYGRDIYQVESVDIAATARDASKLRGAITALYTAAEQGRRDSAFLESIADYGWAHDGRGHFTINVDGLSAAKALDARLYALLAERVSTAKPERDATPAVPSLPSLSPES